MTTSQIRTKVAKATELLEQIDELKSYIEQLTDGVMSRLASTESNRLGVQEYNMRILNLEAELKALWKTT